MIQIVFEAVEGGKYGMVQIKCNQPSRGRYVSIQIIDEEDAILTVCQLFVFQSITEHCMLNCSTKQT